MSYQILDVRENKEVRTYNTKEGVVYFFLQNSSYCIDYAKRPWKPMDHWNINRLFRQLNVTGHDTYCSESMYQEEDTNREFDFDFMTEALRPYQVIDEDNKSCDPRHWTEAIQKVLTSAKPYQYNEKTAPTSTPIRINPNQPIRSLKMPAMYHRNLQLSQSEVGEEHYSKNSGVRKRGLNSEDAFDRAERKLFEAPPKSWKSLTKNPNQWGKKKGTCNTDTIRKSIDMEDDMEEEFEEN